MSHHGIGAAAGFKVAGYVGGQCRPTCIAADPAALPRAVPMTDICTHNSGRWGPGPERVIFRTWDEGACSSLTVNPGATLSRVSRGGSQTRPASIRPTGRPRSPGWRTGLIDQDRIGLIQGSPGRRLPSPSPERRAKSGTGNSGDDRKWVRDLVGRHETAGPRERTGCLAGSW